MKVANPNIIPPVDFEGEAINVQYDRHMGRAWVCIDGQSALRVKGLKTFTVENFLAEAYRLKPMEEMLIDIQEQIEQALNSAESSHWEAALHDIMDMLKSKGHWKD